MININKNPEPNCLTTIRTNINGTPATASLSGGTKFYRFRRRGRGNCKRTVQNSILREQGNICCYCMGKVKLPSSPATNNFDELRMEHYKPKSIYDGLPPPTPTKPDLSLRYDNLLGACNGNRLGGVPAKHCDNLKNKTELVHTPNPSQVDWSTFIGIVQLEYLDSGEVKSNDPNINTEIGGIGASANHSILNLNHQSIVNARKAAWDPIYSLLKRWSKQRTNGGLDQNDYDNKIISLYNSYLWPLTTPAIRTNKEYCGIVVYLLEQTCRVITARGLVKRYP